MKTAALSALAIMALSMPASAAMLERQAGRAIRNAGHWCDRVSNMAVNTKTSTPQRRVVRVTCDDGTRYVQYDLVLGADDKVTSIIKQ
jgi:flagellar basal body-associated protein FliL